MIAYCGSIDAHKHGPTTEMNPLDFVSVFAASKKLTKYGAYNAYRMPVVRDDDEGVKQARKRRHKESRRLYEKVDTVTEPIATAGGLDGRHGGSSIQYYFSRGSLRDVNLPFPAEVHWCGRILRRPTKPLTAVAKTRTATTRALLLSISHVNGIFLH